MDASTALTVMPLAETMELGTVLAKSGFFSDSTQAAQAVVKVLAGRELGIGPIAAMTGIYIVKGKPSIGANLMAGVIKRSGRYNYRVRKLDNTECTIEFYERNGSGWESIGVSTFTIDDARKAQTQNLDKFPRNMLFARAMSNGAKWYCADCFGGAPIYTPEELGAPVNEDGEVIEGAYKPVVTPQPEPQTTTNGNGNGHTPPAQPQPRPTNGNGTQQQERGGIADILTPEYAKQVDEFAAMVPYYLDDKTGKPDHGHIRGAAKKLGYPKITTENIGAMWAALKQYAIEQAALPQD